MSQITKPISYLTLGLVLIPSLLFFCGVINLNAAKTVAVIGSIGWFVATPMWMSRELPVDAAEVEI